MTSQDTSTPKAATDRQASSASTPYLEFPVCLSQGTPIFRWSSTITAPLVHLGIEDVAARELTLLLAGAAGGSSVFRAINDMIHYEREALSAIAFSQWEALSIVDAVRVWPISLPDDARCLIHEVEALLEHDYDTPEEDRAALLHKLRQLTPLSALAVVRASQRFILLEERATCSPSFATHLRMVGLTT